MLEASSSSRSPLSMAANLFFQSYSTPPTEADGDTEGAEPAERVGDGVLMARLFMWLDSLVVVDEEAARVDGASSASSGSGSARRP